MSKADIAEKAIKVLTILGYAYVILTPEGEILAQGEVNPKVRKRNPVNPEHKGYREWLRDKGLDDLQPECYMEIDPEGRDIDALRSIASGLASKLWGAGNHTSNTAGGKLTVIRLG